MFAVSNFTLRIYILINKLQLQMIFISSYIALKMKYLKKTLGCKHFSTLGFELLYFHTITQAQT